MKIAPPRNEELVAPLLVTAPFCCDRKDRAASAQSFTLWPPLEKPFQRLCYPLQCVRGRSKSANFLIESCARLPLRDG